MNKDIKRILIVLGLYSLAGGLFYSFQELWMQSNNLSITTIGNVYSIGAILSVSVIFLCSSVINQRRLKKFVLSIILIKTLSLFILFFINGSNFFFLIKFIIMIDYVVDVEIYTCIYPMLSTITKNDKLYAKRGLIYSLFYYLGTLLAGVLLGRILINFEINYNIYVFIAAMLMLIAFIILMGLNLNKYIKDEPKRSENTILILKLVKEIKNDKITIFYLMFIVLGQISYYSIMGLLVTILSNYFNFSDSIISISQIIAGFTAVLVGAIVLEKLTFKSDYINIGIKFGGRLLFYFIAIILNNKIMYLVAFIYILLFSESYTHVSDAPYINRFDNEYQLAFCNLRDMFSYFGRSIGTFLCGILFVINIRLNFLIASIFILAQITFIYLAIHTRKKVTK